MSIVSYKDKTVTFPLFNTFYPQNPARNPARFFEKIIIDFLDIRFLWRRGTRFLILVVINTNLNEP
jgi:hypothetical protein